MKRTIRMINDLILDGKIDKAEETLHEAMAGFPGDISLHKMKIRLLLVNNRSDQALQYIEALDSFPEVELIITKANLLISLDRGDDALEILKKEVPRIDECTDLRLLGCLCEAFESSGDVVEALKIAKKIEALEPGRIPLPVFRRLQMHAVRQSQRQQSLKEMLEEYDASDNFKPDAVLAAKLYAKFRGKSGSYARQTLFKHGNWGYVPVDEDLSPEKVLEHLLGRETVGIYLLNCDSGTRLLCLDIDIEKSAMPGFLDGSRTDELISDLKKTVHKLCGKYRDCGWPLYPERSGRKGIHLWGFLEEPVQAREVRAVASAMLQGVTSPPGINIEIFPKQDRLTGKGYGNLVKLPLGIHFATGRRSMFLHPDTLECHPKPAEYLDQAASLSQEAFRNVVKGLALKNPQNSKIGLISAINPGIALLPHAVARFPEIVPERIEVLGKACGMFLSLMRRARSGERLLDCETHVLAYLLKPLGEEGEIFFHQLMGLNESYNPDWGIAKLRSVCPTLISCQKIRQRLPQFSGLVTCECNFELSGGEYPSPLIHAGIRPSSPNRIPYGDETTVSGNESGNVLNFEEKVRMLRMRLEHESRQLRILEEKLPGLAKNGDPKTAAGE